MRALAAKCVEFCVRGDWSGVRRGLRTDRKALERTLARYGEKGVEALAQATPRRTGKTAESWRYRLEWTKEGAAIIWENDNAPGGVPVALLLQYGHGTKSGVYVAGKDYINPAMKPVFDQLSQELWKEVRGWPTR